MQPLRRSAALLPLLAIACSSTIAAHRPLGDDAVAQLNEAIGDRTAKVELDRQPPLMGKDVRFGRDLTVFQQLQPAMTSRNNAVPTEALRTVSFRRPTTASVLTGGAVGLVVGAAAGIAIGGSTANHAVDSQEIEYQVAGLFIGALSGLALGLATGSAIGSVTTIEFGGR